MNGYLGMPNRRALVNYNASIFFKEFNQRSSYTNSFIELK